MRRFLIIFWETVEVAVTAIVAVLIIRTFLVQPFLVSGASMEDNFLDGDYLIIDELTYRFREPQRGEVVVFRYPNNRKTYFIKRIIGLPGERLIIKNGKITIINEVYPDGLFLSEDYLSGDQITSGGIDVKLGRDQYFVLGDNRLHSYDSRSWGTVPQNDLIGLVRLKLWPVSKAAVY